jgi:hypothetical protein
MEVVPVCGMFHMLPYGVGDDWWWIAMYSSIDDELYGSTRGEHVAICKYGRGGRKYSS